MDGKAFDLWVAKLEFSYDAWSRKKPVDLEEWILKSNLRGWDKIFSLIRHKCQAPHCHYPLRENECYHILGVGNVCNLCHYMHTIVREKPFFVHAQQQDDERKRR